MSNLQAAMGCAQTERIAELIEKKRQIFAWYKELLKGVPCQMNETASYAQNGYWLPTVIFDKSINFNREELFAYHKKINIDTRPFFYPLSSLPMFTTKPGNTVSYDIYYRGINLPSFHNLTKAEADLVGGNNP
jgi:perosamine synthetase